MNYDCPKNKIKSSKGTVVMLLYERLISLDFSFLYKTMRLFSIFYKTIRLQSIDL